MTSEVAPWLERRRQEKRIAEEKLLAQQLNSQPDSTVQNSRSEKELSAKILQDTKSPVGLEPSIRVVDTKAKQKVTLEPEITPKIKREINEKVPAKPVHTPSQTEQAKTTARPLPTIAPVSSTPKTAQVHKTQEIHTSKPVETTKEKKSTIRVYDWRPKRNSGSWFSTEEGKRYLEQEDDE